MISNARTLRNENNRKKTIHYKISLSNYFGGEGVPRAKKVLSEKQFKRLSFNQQINEVASMSKIMNTRRSLLESKGELNEVYQRSSSFLQEQGKNKYYQGKKYTQDEVLKTFQHLSDVMTDKRSTLSGVKNSIADTINNIRNNNNGMIQFADIKNFTEQEKLYTHQMLAKESNQKLGKLEKQGLETNAYKTAGYFNEETGRNKNRFYRGKKFKNNNELNIQIQNEMIFLNSPTSTKEGYNEQIIGRIKLFKEHGVNIPKNKEQDFIDFLSSQQFKALKKYGDSGQVAEIFAVARNKGKDVDEINREFTKYMNGEIEIDEVEENLGTAPWLLH